MEGNKIWRNAVSIQPARSKKLVGNPSIFVVVVVKIDLEICQNKFLCQRCDTLKWQVFQWTELSRIVQSQNFCLYFSEGL